MNRYRPFSPLYKNYIAHFSNSLHFELVVCIWCLHKKEQGFHEREVTNPGYFVENVRLVYRILLIDQHPPPLWYWLFYVEVKTVLKFRINHQPQNGTIRLLQSVVNFNWIFSVKLDFSSLAPTAFWWEWQIKFRSWIVNFGIMDENTVPLLNSYFDITLWIAKKLWLDNW